MADLIAEMNELIDNRKAVPDDRAKVANLMFMLEGQDIVSGLLSADKDEGQIQAMVGLLESAQVRGMIVSLDRYLGAMDRELVEVRMDSLPPGDRDVVARYRAGRVAEEIRWLVQKRLGNGEHVSPSLDARAVSGENLSLQKLLPLLPPPLADSKDFRAEAEGALSDLAQVTVAVPRSLYKKLSAASGGSPEPIRFNVRYTGIPVISWHLDQSVLMSQAESLGIAFVFIFVLLALKLRSWRGGLLGLAPIGLAVVVMFGIMGFTGIPINVATVLVGAIALGIGIDYSIHFSVRFSTYYRGPQTAGRPSRRLSRPRVWPSSSTSSQSPWVSLPFCSQACTRCGSSAFSPPWR